MNRILEESTRDANPVVHAHAWKSPSREGTCVMNLYAHHSVYQSIIEQAESALPNETGGFLLGQAAFDPDTGSWHNWIDEAVPIVASEANPVHFSFSWRDVDSVRNRREQEGKSLIGWYHTHPGLGIFLSETDLNKTHGQLFNEGFQVALVYDPISGRAGYFFREPSGFLDSGTASWREFQLIKSGAGSERGHDSATTIIHPNTGTEL